MKSRNVYTLLILLLVGAAAPAQPYYGWRLGAGVGGAAYYGEVSYRLGTAKVSWPAYHLLLGRSLSPSLDVELNAGWGRFSASDQATDWRGKLRTDNPDFARGLHFQTRFRNAGLLLQYKFNNGYLLSRYARLAPYAFAGGGITDFTVYGDPQPDGSFGTRLSARESGAGYPTRVLTVPFGAGVRWHISDRFAADVRAGAQYAFSDYLDHVKAGRGHDVYFTAGVSLQYQFDLGRDKFRGPVAYAGSKAFTSPGTSPVAVSGNRAEWDDRAEWENIGRLRPDLDVTVLRSDGPAELADAFVEEARIQPQTGLVRGPDTRRATQEEGPERWQPGDRLTGPGPATQVNPDSARGYPNPPQPAADAPRRYNRNGKIDVNTPADEARLQQLEAQVAGLNRQLEALRQTSRRADQLPLDNEPPGARHGNNLNGLENNGTYPNRRVPAELRSVPVATPGNLNEERRQTALQLTVITTQLAALKRQQKQLLADTSAEKQLDSLITQVTRLSARLDTSLAAAENGPQREVTRNLTTDHTPLVNGNTDSGDPDGTADAAPERIAPAPDVAPDAVQRQLDELRRSIDALHNRLTADNGRATLPKRLPYGPLVIYYPLNSAVMGPDDRQRLDALVKGLVADSTAVVEIKGFADQTGNAAYNLALSRRRAENVRGYLVNAFGLKPGQIVINYFGQALATREPENPYDRRVELVIYAAGE